jgi:hypothetical protein
MQAFATVAQFFSLWTTHKRREEKMRTEMEERLSAMRQTIKTADRLADTWEPDVNDELVGLVVTKRKVVFEKKDEERASDIYDFDIGDRTIAVWDSADLNRQFTSLKVRFGDIVGIRFLGTAKGSTKKLFAVRVDHVNPDAELVCPPPPPPAPKAKNDNGKAAADDVPF